MKSGGIVTSIVRGGATWLYNYAVFPTGVSTLSVTDPTNRVRKYTSDRIIGLPTRVEDEYGRVSLYSYDSRYRLKTATSPGGQVTTYSYDARGNVTDTVVTPASGGAALSTAAAYPPDCANAVTCNSPISTTDARKQVTTYTYDPIHGGVTTVTAPAVNGVSPQTRYGYAQIAGTWLQTSVATCRTMASCAGTADEVKTTTAYNANLLPTSVTSGAGDGSLSATTTATYTAAGDVLTVDGPLAGAADTTRAYYDTMRRPLGTIGADPDGGGPLPNRAVRANYDPQGRLASQDYGTAAGQGDASLAAMTVRQTVAATFDAAGRTISTTLSAGGTAYARSETGYDLAGRVTCAAQRMNPAAFGSGTSACDPGPAGSFGADRVTRTAYGPLLPTMSVTRGYGTPEASTESITYGATGKPATVTDAMNNVTAFIYDGFDRLSQKQLPAAPQGANASNGNDHEEYGYDENGNMTAMRKRDGRLLVFAYDALDRPISKTMDQGCAPRQVGGCTPSWATRGVYYGYDLLGRLTFARFDSPSGEGIGATYDALGRTTSTSSTMGGTNRTLGYQYDLQGNRTRITHPDGVYFTMAYDALGGMATASWTAPGTGTVPFLSLSYDDLGRRTAINRASSTTGYGYDSASRLATLSQGFAGGVGNAATTFSYNPASQIVSRTHDNDAYAFTGAVNVDRPYATNGLNQYASAGAAYFDYDTNGNLINDSKTAYAYDVENRLVSTSTGASLTYDPLGRLWQTSSSSFGKTQFVYDGDHIAVEYDGDTGAMRRRAMFGPGADEPIMVSDGSTMACSSDKFLHTDERGSIVALADCWGKRTEVNSYDEFGIPGAGNKGRFQYTGQAWIADLGMYYYKARMYSPTMGRFMQTDPIGYGDGLNWYDYVGGDPVNKVDPSGMQEDDVIVIQSTGEQACRANGRRWIPDPGGNPRKGHCQGLSGIPYGIERRFVALPVPGYLGSAPQNMNRNGRKPSSHDDGDPDYNRDLNKCRALADSGNRAAASICYGNAEKRRRLRDDGVPEYDLPPLVKSAAAGVAAGVLLYWLISEGSRLFPPRNLIPIP